MNLENVHYDAFISYRHTDRDMFVAKEVHKRLEAFRLPKSLRKQDPSLPVHIERVFRDQEELPLTTNLADPITEALRNSDNLIVICTPRLRESLWCQKEIETFISMHGRNRVFAVLAEGEPSESFPDQLLYNEKGEPIEPLGADARGETEADVKKKLDSGEILRLIAPMFNLNFDDLRQRRREQRQKKIMTLGGIIAAAAVAFGVYMGITSYRIGKQNEQIKAQNVEIQAQSDEIREQNEELKEQKKQIETQNYELAGRLQMITAKEAEDIVYAGRRIEALKLLRETMPDTTDDAHIPYCADAQRVLTEILDVYNEGLSFMQLNVVDNVGTLYMVDASPDGRYVAYSGSDGGIHILSREKLEEIAYLESELSQNQNSAGFISDTEFLFNRYEGVYIYNAETGTDKLFADMYAGHYALTPDGSRIVLASAERIRCYDLASGAMISEINLREDDELRFIGNEIAISQDGSYLAVCAYPNVIGSYGTDLYLSAYDLTSGDRIFLQVIEGEYSVSSLYFDEESIFVGYNVATMQSLVNGPESFVLSVDRSGRRKWNSRISNASIHEIEVIHVGEDSYLYCRDVSSLYTIDPDDGTMIFTDTVDGTILNSKRLTDTIVLILSSDGNMYSYNIVTGYCVNMLYFQLPTKERVVAGRYTRAGVFLQLVGTDYMTRYISHPNPEVRELPSLPESIVYAYDLYNDEPVLIPGTEYYLGYETIRGMVLLNDKGEVVAQINNGYGIDSETGEIIMTARGSDGYVAVKPYSYDELIALADELLSE